MVPSWVRTWANRIAILVLVLVPFLGTLSAIRWLWLRAVTWSDLLLLVALYLPISLGVTVGFHRYLTHRGFQTSRPLAAILLILGSMAVLGSPLAFAANHRKHHAFSDRDGDPHSPLHGFFHAHVGWLLAGQVADEHVFARDLRADRLVVSISHLFPLWALLGLALPYALGGWQGLVWGGLVRVFLTHHVTWSVNSVCHTFGRRPFATRDRSRNEWVVGLLALGEGWHNNHHAFPRSAMHGLRWWQVDLSGSLIGLLAVLRVVWDVQRVTPEARRARAACGALGAAA